jgi:TRAP-type mannitol/chloroaromatic compound transport system permease small subunit
LARAIDRSNERLGRAVVWLTLVMVLVGSFNAIARYLGPRVGLQLSSNAYIELQWYLFSLVFLLAGAYTLKHDRHVRVDVFYARLSARRQAWIDLAGTLLFLIPFSAVGLWVSWPAVRASWTILEGSPDPGGLPRYPIKAVILIAFVLLIVQGLAELIRRVAFLRGAVAEPAPPREPRHGEVI